MKCIALTVQIHTMFWVTTCSGGIGNYPAVFRGNDSVGIETGLILIAHA